MWTRDAKAKIIRNGQFGSYRCSVIVNSLRRFVASSCVHLFRVLISQSMYPVKWWQEWSGGTLVPWYPGTLGCAGEHLNAAVSQNIGAAAPLTHPHQMAASSPHALYHQVETHHCHLLICSYNLKMLMFCMKYSLLRDEDMMATVFTLNFESLEVSIWSLISGTFFTGKHAGCWLVSQDLLSPSLGAYFEIIMHLVQL